MPTDDLSTRQSEKPAYKYFVFISYSRKDSRAAKWLQKRLEWFRFPVKLVESNRRPNDPRYLRPVYRDKTNLEVDHAHYWENIKQAIEQSRYLVVLCTPDAAKSGPVDLEVSHFLSTRENAIEFVEPVILRGDVAKGGESECLCPNLLNLGSKITDRNLPSMVPDAEDSELEGWENGFVGVACYLLNLERKSLRDHVLREERKRVAKARVLAALFAVLALGAIVGAVFAYRNGLEARKQKADAIVARDQETAAKLDAESKRKDAELARDLEAKQKALAEQKTKEAEESEKKATELKRVAEEQTIIAKEQTEIALREKEEAISREATLYFHNALNNCRDGHSYEALLEANKALNLKPDMPGPLGLAAELISRKWWPIQVACFKPNESGEYRSLIQISSVLWLDKKRSIALGYDGQGSLVVDYDSGNSYYTKREIFSPTEVDYSAFNQGPQALGDEYVVGYDKDAKQLKGARMVRSYEDRSLHLEIVDGKIEKEKFIPGISASVDFYDVGVNEEVGVVGFVNCGKTVLVTSNKKTWLVSSDNPKYNNPLDLAAPAVNRLASSPSGRYAAMVSADTKQFHGANNLRVSVLDFGSPYADQTEITRGWSLSEQTPIQNRFIGFTGTWGKQGFTEIHFTKEDEFVIFCGANIYRYQLYDRRAWEVLTTVKRNPKEKQNDEFKDDENDDRMLTNHIAEYAHGSTVRDGQATLSCAARLVTLYQTFPVVDLAWTKDHRYLVTQAQYKGYGNEILVWDGASGERVMGPISKKFASEEFSLSLEDLIVQREMNSSNPEVYLREIFVPRTESLWMKNLIQRILGVSDSPKNVFEDTNSNLLMNGESDLEKSWRLRLTASKGGDSLPCIAGSTITRAEQAGKIKKLQHKK